MYNDDTLSPGYGIHDHIGFTADDYGNGTSFWNVHQDRKRGEQEERVARLRNGGDLPWAPLTDALPHKDGKKKSEPLVMPELGKNSFGMDPYVLCCSLFSIASRKVKGAPRIYREETILTTNGGSIEYCGPELHQEDESVLFGLVKLAQGMDEAALADPKNAITFAATTFCKLIGWSDNDTNPKRLEQSLLRLRGAILVLRRGKGDLEEGTTVGIVKDINWKGVRKTVQLDPRIVGLFKGHVTYLNMEKRKLLTEGLQTWLYGLVCANNCAVPFTLEKLHNASGSKANSMKEFGRSVREALTKMVAVGVIKSFKTERGAIHITK